MSEEADTASTRDHRRTGCKILEPPRTARASSRVISSNWNELGSGTAGAGLTGMVEFGFPGGFGECGETLWSTSRGGSPTGTAEKTSGGLTGGPPSSAPPSMIRQNRGCQCSNRAGSASHRFTQYSKEGRRTVARFAGLRTRWPRVIRHDGEPVSRRRTQRDQAGRGPGWRNRGLLFAWLSWRSATAPQKHAYIRAGSWNRFERKSPEPADSHLEPVSSSSLESELSPRDHCSGRSTVGRIRSL